MNDELFSLILQLFRSYFAILQDIKAILLYKANFNHEHWWFSGDRSTEHGCTLFIDRWGLFCVRCLGDVRIVSARLM